MAKSFCSLIFIFIFSTLSWAQVYQLSDEQLIERYHQAQGEEFFEVLEELCFRSAYSNLDQLRSYANEAFTTNEDAAYQAKIYNHLALGELSFGKLDSALELAQKGLKLRQTVGDSLEIASSFTRIGQVYKDLGQFDAAIENYMKALDIFETTT